MLSTATIAVALLSGLVAAQNKDTTHSREMGPAAFMWPPDRPWSAEADNIPPCGSSSGVGNRTEFPLNPTKIDDFEIFYSPTQLDPVLDVGHTCILAPNPPTNVTAGSNATFMFFYMEDGGSENSPFWACTDITYVDTAAFDESIPCFNATREDPDVSTDGPVSVTTTLYSSGGKQSASGARQRGR
ncbi:hypothetical protein AC578_3837 [Pseudocercospora eumusae]|uniref:Copper acquisition factor BIM1-like domain-containing protein n=1 Tax=Pseudocercospora eumusae TaxID=321146 RepID=A0A139GXQ3_9PEZI|nr:hypothetical protein AC578_3837 [Pseudocercospora eumusae]